jgi:hypothetical protein
VNQRKHTFTTALVLLLAVSSLLLPGCGRFLYLTGFGSAEQVEAKFKLTEEPILVLLDDPGDRLQWPPAEYLIFDAITQELLRTESAKKIVPFETIQRLRQTDEKYYDRSCRWLGEQAGAKQVLWLKIDNFLLPAHAMDVQDAAYVSLSVKVIDVTTEKGSASKARLWPQSPAGELVSASLPAETVTRLDDPRSVCSALGDAIGMKVARLFHDHQLGDTEKPE